MTAVGKNIQAVWGANAMPCYLVDSNRSCEIIKRQ
jgi:hypothetical protein